MTESLLKIAADKLGFGTKKGAQVSTENLLDITINGTSPVLRNVAATKIAARTDIHNALETTEGQEHFEKNGLYRIRKKGK